MKTKSVNFTLQLYQSPQTVFLANEIGMLTKEDNEQNLKSRINYYVKRGVLTSPRKGIYVKPGFNSFELGEKIYKPSYISLQTVLESEGVIFQDYQTIFLVSYLSRELKVDRLTFSYRKIKNDILINTSGIIQKDNYWIAEKERAFLDMVYLYGNYYFDNLGNINWQKCFDIAGIYRQKKLIKRLNKYFEESKNA